MSPRAPHHEAVPAAAALVAWFRSHGKDHPWRRTRDPYAILVSEIMLQQTQIATVVERGYYTRWLERFPDFHALAQADEVAVLQAWEGLGYYRRARNLHRLAKAVMTEHDGVLPRNRDKLLALPGIGPYTAGAVASFAFGLPEAIVDGNVARVLSRMHADDTPIDSRVGIKRLWERAGELVRHAEDPRALNSALMELGQTCCTPMRPACDVCPVRRHCRATEPESLPVKQTRQAITAVTERVVFMRDARGVLLEQETGTRRTGLWKLPALPASHAEPLPPVLLRSHYGITRYKVTLWVHAAPGTAGWPATHRVVAIDDLDATPMPAPYRRALRSLLQQGAFKLES